MAHSISNSDNIIDSRDVIARIEELESEKEDFETEAEENETGETWEDENPEEAEELKALQELAEEAEGYAPDWRYGVTLINEDYFTEYCEQMVVDIGDLPSEIPAYLEIDWEATADNLRVDYTKVDFDGRTYLVR